MHLPLPRIALPILLLAAHHFGTFAQTAPERAGKPLPSASAAAPPAAPLPTTWAAGSSAFDRYRRYAEQPVGNWRDANDTVGRIGGWKAYARESQAPAAPSAAEAP